MVLSVTLLACTSVHLWGSVTVNAVKLATAYLGVNFGAYAVTNQMIKKVDKKERAASINLKQSDLNDNTSFVIVNNNEDDDMITVDLDTDKGNDTRSLFATKPHEYTDGMKKAFGSRTCC
ncbi:hypothetical protein BDF19DRAFT_416408 [Syncephalis fuscata]|nr:hypothetical protein BDF19DRAFT_416408 [Syncephalis fuscata]